MNDKEKPEPDKPKRSVGRPPKLVPPERIPDTPEGIAKALVRTSLQKFQTWKQTSG